MGRDKALVEVRGVPMVLRVAEALLGAGADTVTTIGGDLRALGALGLDARADPWPGEGPLGGLLGALRAAGSDSPDPADVLVVVACDLPELTPGPIQALVRAVLGGHDVALARTDRLEPLCGAWKVSTCEPVLRVAFERGERAVHRALAGLDVVEITVGAASLRNVNRPDDL